MAKQYDKNKEQVIQYVLGKNFPHPDLPNPVETTVRSP